MSAASGEVIAVALAAVGAVLFGLAAVRQHGAVREVVADEGDPGPAEPTGHAVRRGITSALRLVRQRDWLVGAVQAMTGAGLHVVALALAPITLVQPIGVLAVPVTLTAAAVRHHRRPVAAQLVGTALSVLGIAALTVVLLLPPAGTPALPSLAALVTTTVGLVVVGGGLALLAGRLPAPVRCLVRAVVAAALFGLNSVLIRVVGEVVGGASSTEVVGLVVVSVVGVVLALSLGVWAMQAAYAAGAPQVVICVLTLVDPLSAVTGGRLLLHDGAALSTSTVLLAAVCALVAAAGVVLLARVYPTDVDEPVPPQPGHERSAVS